MRISVSLGAWRPVLRHSGDAQGVAITVDDAPTPSSTPGLLAALAAHGATATFFLSGCRAVLHPELVAQIVAAGHAVYAHGWEHVRLDHAGTARLIADFERCEALLRQFRPTPRPYIVRMPYNGGYRNAAVHRALARWQPGCQIAHWLVSTEDHLISPRCEQATDVPAQVAAETARLVADPRLPGSILLMHDEPINERPGAQFKTAVTVTLMEQVLAGLSGAGLRAVPLAPRATPSLASRFVFS